MESLSFSTKSKAAGVFMDLLQSISVRGWFNAGPSGSEQDSLLFISFHIHPDDADYIHEIMSQAFSHDFFGIKWDVKRTKHNRFFLCPMRLSILADELGGFEAALDEVQQQDLEFGELAAKSLIEASKAIFDQFKASGKSKFEERVDAD
ncbi:hypothetical protein V8J88_18440 [Massilia sp. W12]|uniref:hypothetical protein n=1 Tax=Massilia sp. W12 TaxID=3126507 RepID=UPI0030D1C4B6